MRALAGSTAGVIASTFTFAGPGLAGSGSGTINGAAPGLDFIGGVISWQRTGVPGCSFTGTVNLVR